MTNDYVLDEDGNYPEGYQWETVTLRVRYTPPLPRVIIAPSVQQLAEKRERSEDLEFDRYALSKRFESLRGNGTGIEGILVGAVREELIERYGSDYENAPIKDIKVVDGSLPSVR